MWQATPREAVHIGKQVQKRELAQIKKTQLPTSQKNSTIVLKYYPLSKQNNNVYENGKSSHTMWKKQLMQQVTIMPGAGEPGSKIKFPK